MKKRVQFGNTRPKLKKNKNNSGIHSLLKTSMR